MRGDELLGAKVSVLMVATWFAMRFLNWRQHEWVIFLSTVGTVGFYFVFRCAAGGIGSVSSGMM